MTEPRRVLSFVRLDDVVPDLDRLLAGHVTVGRWSLGQICHHLATSLRRTLEGPPGSSAPTREQDVLRRRFFRTGRFPEGMEIPSPALIPPEGTDARTEAESLRDAIRRWQRASGPFPHHPVLGPLSPDEWDHFHRIHCAHHLSFAMPSEA